VARVDTQGQLLWAAQIASENVNVNVVAGHADGSVWVAGYLLGALGRSATIEVAPGTAAALSAETASSARFVVRFSPEGEPAWLVPFERDAPLGTDGLAASPTSLVAVGEFSGNATFGSAEHELSAVTDNPSSR